MYQFYIFIDILMLSITTKCKLCTHHFLSNDPLRKSTLSRLQKCELTTATLLTLTHGKIAKICTSYKMRRYNVQYVIESLFQHECLPCI